MAGGLLTTLWFSLDALKYNSEETYHAMLFAFLASWAILIGCVLIDALLWGVRWLDWCCYFLAYHWHLENEPEAAELAVPTGLKENWQAMKRRHRKEMKHLGGQWPRWADGLAENYDVVLACTPILEMLRNPGISKENRLRAKQRMLEHFDKLAECYLESARAVYSAEQEAITGLNADIAAKLTATPDWDECC